MTSFKSISVFCISFIFALSNLVGAQPLSKMVVINSENGLSQNSVYSIFKDRKGFLWIGTGDGLNRYDGSEFVIYRNSSRASPQSLKGFTINYNIAEDNFDNLWITTERNLVKFNQQSQEFTEIIPVINGRRYAGNKIIVSIDTSKNTIWFITPTECLFSYNYATEIFKRFVFPEINSIHKQLLNPETADDTKGNIWISSPNGIYKFNKSEERWKHYFDGSSFHKICFGSNGKLWAINDNEVFYLDTNANRRQIKNHLSKSGSYISIVADNHGKIWCGTIDGKLFYASVADKEMHFAGDITDMSGSQNILELRCLYIDKSGLLWIGTEGGGIIKFGLHPQNFYNYPSDVNFPAKSLYVKSLYCDSDGKVWLGTFKKGIYLFDPQTLQPHHLEVPANKYFEKRGDVVYSITKDKEGIYWFGYDGCLIAYNKEKKQFFFHPVPQSVYNRNPSINQVRVCDSFLMVAATSGLYKVYTSAQGKNASFKLIIPEGIMETLKDSEGTLWASSIYTGLLKIRNENDHYTFSNYFSNNGFRCLLEDKKNKILWGASQMGLLAYHLPTGKYKFYDESDGLLNNYVYAIIQNGNEIWVSTNKGIARGFLSFQKNKFLPDIFFKGYTKEDGLQSNEYNTGAYGASPGGYIFFGGIHGVNWFLPKNVSGNLNKPGVAITGLKINDSSYHKDISADYLKTITTSYKKNTFTITFIGLEFSNPKKISYKFKMEGLEKKWTIEQNAHEVRYVNIPPGHYTFRLVAANSDNLPSDEKQLSITILPPFYSSWWFLLFVSAILLFLIIVTTKKISQYKLKKKVRLLEKEKALEDERHRISKEMHDDLGAGLTQISLMSEAAKRRNKAGKTAREELNDISLTSKQLIENVSEIIWAMNPEFDTLSGMFSYLREQATKLLEYSGKEYQIELPEDYTDINISNTKRKNILMLVKEAVNNAIKHSGASFISVKISLIDYSLEMEIKDNGHGFDVNQISRGHGMKNYAFRTSLLHGSSKVISGPKGTEVYFNVSLEG